MGLLATMQNSILSFVSNTTPENDELNQHALYQLLSRRISTKKNIKMLIPYSPKKSFYPLLDMGPATELVYLNAKERETLKQPIPKQETMAMISFVDKDLRAYRAPADFDCVLYSVPLVAGAADRIPEDLCHCRMLLKPGGHLFLHLPKNKTDSFTEIVEAHQRVIPGILSSAGLANIVDHKLSREDTVYSGQRPSFHF